MANPGNYNNSSLQGADLKEHDKLALEEGHDADLPNSHSDGKRSDEPERTDIEKEAGQTSAESTEATETIRDPNEVWWDHPETEDPANPQNWTSGKKWTTIAVLSFVTLITYVHIVK
jgi:hypothetical protein